MTEQPIAQASPDARQAASALDALIRTTRNRTRGLLPTSQRVLDCWRDGGIVTLYLKPDGLHTANDMEERTLALARSRQEGRWILVAFMAGLRAITINGNTHPDDLSCLAIELGALRPSREGIEAFRSWLIAEGAATLEVTTETSFIEVFDTLDAQDLTSSMMGRHIRPPSAPDALTLRANELQKARDRQELRMSLELFSAGRSSRGFEMMPGEDERLRAQLSSPRSWFLAELDALLTTPALQKSASVDRLARRILDALGESCDEEILDRLLLFFQSTERFHRGLCDDLVGGRIGEHIAMNLDAESVHSYEMLAMLQALPVASASELMRAALLRSLHDASFYERFEQLAAELEQRALLALFDPTQLDVGHLPTLRRLLIARGLPPDHMERYVALMSPSLAIRFLSELPDLYMVEMDRVILSALASLEAEELLEQLPTLSAHRAPIIGEMYVQTLKSSRRSGWSYQLVELFLDRVLEQYEHDLLIELARNRRVDRIVRIQALRRLDHDQKEELLERAVSWHIAELFESSQLTRLRRTYREQLAKRAPNGVSLPTPE